jgi:hypothetical protein
VVLRVATMAFAANGDAWRLGRNNVATAITRLGVSRAWTARCSG